jgi:hypothetical protein
VTGDWPRTGRLLPWLIALFLSVLWLVPSDAIELSIPLPIDPHPDRFLLLVLAVVVLASALAGQTRGGGTPAPSVSLTLLLFVTVAVVSLAANSHALAGLGELEQGRNQLLLLVTYMALFWVVATVVRPSELRRFSVLIVVLATITAAGTIWEYRTDYNVFYDLANKLFGAFASVESVPRSTLDSRDETFGPTQHGLAITMMLTFALPFAMLGLASARTHGRKVLYGLAVALIFAGAISTQRKTSLIAPAAAVIVLTAYRPRQMLRLAPLGLVMVVLIQAMAPGALGGVVAQITGGFFESGSTIGRTSDYEAIAPEIATYPLLGRGYGTVNPARSDTYRILDNQYLSNLIQVGYLGLGAYIALIATAMALAHRVIRRGGDDARRSIGLAALPGFAAFAVANSLFDLSSFGQVPYLFCFIVGLCSVAATRTAPAPRPSLVPARARREVPAL